MRALWHSAGFSPRRILERVGAALGALAIVLLSTTWSVRRRFEGGWGAYPAIPPGVYLFHHNTTLISAGIHRGRGHGTLVSLHQDGEWIAQISGWLGFTVVRGSSSRGGTSALRGVEHLVSRLVRTAVTVDGPRGPRYEVKEGPVAMAMRTEHPLVPFAMGSNHFWQLPSWDRFRIPKPFARIEVFFGPPIRVPPGLDREGLQLYRRQAEDELLRLTNGIDRLLGLPPELHARRLERGEAARPPRGERRIRSV